MSGHRIKPHSPIASPVARSSVIHSPQPRSAWFAISRSITARAPIAAEGPARADEPHHLVVGEHRGERVQVVERRLPQEQALGLDPHGVRP